MLICSAPPRSPKKGVYTFPKIIYDESLPDRPALRENGRAKTLSRTILRVRTCGEPGLRGEHELVRGSAAAIRGTPAEDALPEMAKHSEVDF